MKTVTKKLFALLLVAVMMFSAVPFGASASGMTDAPAAMTLFEHNLNWKIFNFGGGEVIGAGTTGANTGYKVTLDWAKSLVEEGYQFLEAHVEYPTLLGAKSARLTEKRPYTVKSDVTVVIYVEPVEEVIPTEPAPTEEVPAPTEETPAPTEETPAPTEETPAPTEETPAPTEETPAPTEETPAPTEETPAPKATCRVELVVAENRTILAEDAFDVLTGEAVKVEQKVKELVPGCTIEKIYGTTASKAEGDYTAEAKALVVDEDISLTVLVSNGSKPEPKGEYTLTFIPEDGYWTSGRKAERTEPKTFTVKAGRTLGDRTPDADDIETTLKRAVFAGWKVYGTGAEFTAHTKVNQDLTLVPNWVNKRETFTITFDPNGGSLRRHEGTMEVHFNEVLDDMPEPSHRNLEFQGWFDENGKEWEDGDIYNVAHDMTLTAKWAKAAKVVLHIYMDGNTKKSVYDIDLHDYVVGDYITMKHVKRDIWETGIEAKPGKQLEYDGLFDSETWERYVRHGRGGEDKIEIENTRRNDIYVMVFNGQTHHRPWDPTNPKTGDQMMLEGAIAVMALAAVGVVTLAALRKKKVL